MPRLHTRSETLPKRRPPDPELFASRLQRIGHFPESCGWTPGIGGQYQTSLRRSRAEFSTGGVPASRTHGRATNKGDEFDSCRYDKGRNADLPGAREPALGSCRDILSVALDGLQFVRDNNGTLIVRDPTEGTASLRVFKSPNRSRRRALPPRTCIGRFDKGTRLAPAACASARAAPGRTIIHGRGPYGGAPPLACATSAFRGTRQKPNCTFLNLFFRRFLRASSPCIVAEQEPCPRHLRSPPPLGRDDPPIKEKAWATTRARSRRYLPGLKRHLVRTTARKSPSSPSMSRTIPPPHPRGSKTICHLANDHRTGRDRTTCLSPRSPPFARQAFIPRQANVRGPTRLTRSSKRILPRATMPARWPMGPRARPTRSV